MHGKLAALPGEVPTMSDWTNHLTTLFPEVRLKRFLEMRGADCGPYDMILALPAFWTGLTYDAQSQAETLSLISDWTQQERDALRFECARSGLAAQFRGKAVKHLAQTVLALSRAGLQRRGLGEEKFLAPLDDIAESGLTLADRQLQLYHGEANGDLGKIYDKLKF